MASENVERRLAAILVADVVGYGRLMAADEMGTLAALKSHQSELIDPKISEFGGHIVKLMGDGVLAEFPSVVNALRCATELQEHMAKRNVEMPDDRRILFRIGVNLGDVIIDGDDIYGDGVNIATRLEGLADPGGVCVSSTVHDHVVGKVDIPLEDDGEHQVKNIAKGLHVWRWSPSGIRLKTKERGTEVPQWSDKPSIAVLPFDNMSDDAEQEYFSDGITEDIITELSRYSDFLVIARNSTFVYKHKVSDHKQIAKDLGVQFVLEGSVRKSGNRVRITAQLVDASSGSHIWAERYDRTLEDIFAVQDEITGTIVSTLGDTIQVEHAHRALSKDASSLDAYDKSLQAWARRNRFSKKNNAEARQLAKEAIELDPDYARAYAILSGTYLMDFSSHWSDDPDKALNLSYETARKAVSLDHHSFYAYRNLGLAEAWMRRHDQAITSFREAIELNPNDADTHAYFANVLVFSGRPDEALNELETAKRLNPRYPNWYLQFEGRAYFVQHRYQDAEIAFARVVTVSPGWPWARLIFAATLAALGKNNEARAEIAEAQRISPAITLAHVPKAWPFKNRADLKHLLETLRKAGLKDADVS